MKEDLHPQRPIDLNDDLAFQERSWRLQRAGWVALFLFVVLILLGAFGGGYLSRRAQHIAGITCQYESITRLGRPSTLQLTALSQPLRVEFSASFLNSVSVSSAGLLASAATRSSAAGSIEILREPASPLLIEYTVNSIGWTETYLTANGQRIPLRFFVFP